MSSDFIARPLPAAQVLQAYPLVQALDPGLSAERWQAFANALGDGGGGAPRDGIMTLQTVAGYIHGLFVHRLHRDLRDGLQLQVDHLVTFELPGRQSALRAALRVVEQLAREQRCDSIAVNMPTSARVGLAQFGSSADAFDDGGYETRAACWRKRLSPPEALPVRQPAITPAVTPPVR